MSANLNAEVRDKLGSRTARKLRAAGRLPISIQGEGKDHVHASLEMHAFMVARQSHEHLFDIKVGGDSEPVVVRELQYDAFGDTLTHVEFQRVVRGREMESEVELTFLGVPKGGILNHLQTHITIRSIPSMIPDGIEVPVGAMEAGHSLLASDIKLPEGFTLACEPDLQVAVVASPIADEPEEGEEGEEEEGAVS